MSWSDGYCDGLREGLREGRAAENRAIWDIVTRQLDDLPTDDGRRAVLDRVRSAITSRLVGSLESEEADSHRIDAIKSGDDETSQHARMHARLIGRLAERDIP